MSEPNGNGARISNQDIDRRVGRLETAQVDQGKELIRHGERLHELGNEMQVVKLQIEHSQRLMSAKFEQVLASSGTTAEQLSRVIERLDAMKDSAARASAEPSATPAGRVLSEAIVSIKGDVARAEKAAAASSAWVLRASGALALLIFLLTIFSPIIQRAFEVKP